MNPKNIENELRKLQPMDVSYHPPANVPKRRFSSRLWLAIPAALAASLFAVFMLNLPKTKHNEIVVQKVEPIREVFKPHFATVRELYADIAKELPVVQDSPMEYKTIELTVADSRHVVFPIERNRRLHDWQDGCFDL